MTVFFSIIWNGDDADRDRMVGPVKPVNGVQNVVCRNELQYQARRLVAGDERFDVQLFDERIERNLIWHVLLGG